MQTTCPTCGSVLEYSGELPRFCGYCGRALSGLTRPTTATATPEEAATLPPRASPSEEATLAPPGTVPTGGVPQFIGGYRLVRPIGQGGMGSVYEAEEVASGRRVALKLVSPDLVTSGETVQRFKQEGRLASKIAHPRCVFVHAADEQAGQPYIVMELMPGENLQDLVAKTGPLPPEEAVAKILDALEGLQEAHRLGVIHRDIKPSNCFLDAAGRVKIGDFGLSKSLTADVKLTRTGAFLGTPLYASPEQIRGEPLDQRSDVYSLAATLYFTLTGRAPHQTGDAAATIARIVADPPPPLRTVRPEIPRALDRVVLRGLERDRKKRYRDLEEFRKALFRFLPARPSLGDTGVRFTAWVVDWVLLIPAIFVLGALANLVLGTVKKLLVGGVATATVDPGQLFGSTLIALLYFGVSEGLWGCTLGKRWFGLRVCQPGSIRPPGVPLAMLRILVLLIFLDVGSWGAIVLTAFGWRAPALVAGAPGLVQLAAYVVLLASMRRRNNYRGLHEWLSGTRTVRLTSPRVRGRRSLRVEESRFELLRPEGMPAQVGPFAVQGALRWGQAERTLLADDRSLGRRVWLWLRPAAQPPLDRTTRDINRATRIRWVAGGTEGEWQWDAFLAPGGCSLPELVRRFRRLPWPEARIVLEDLTEELAASLAEGTLPERLAPEQVWVNAYGRVQLLGSPLPAQLWEERGGVDQPGSARTDQERVLRFLGEVMVLALEGRPRPPGAAPAPVRAPIPVHAATLVNRLLGLVEPPDLTARIVRADLLDWRRPPKDQTGLTGIEEVQAALAQTQDNREEITRRRRAVQLAMLGIMHSPGLVPMVGFTAAALTGIANDRSPSGEEAAALVLALIFPVVWVVWSFLFRGGIMLYRGEMAIRKLDGRPASRLQCAWRTLLVWGPITGLLISALLVAWDSPDEPGLYYTLYGAAVALLVLFPVHAILFPTRGLHDRLAGTCLVPR